MKIDSDILKYLKGELFTTNLIVDFDKVLHEDISRQAAIINIIEGKSVIHMGCSDHLEEIRGKIENHTWLHQLITEKSESCLGIDINKDSIDFIKQEIGYKNVFYGDVLGDNIDIITQRNWDYVIFGELIEHLDEPVNFLRTFKNKYGKEVDKFIVTVPNIYSKYQYNNMLNFKEKINSDHRFWFTPYTISKILISAGYLPEKITYSNLRLTTYDLIIRKIKHYANIKAKYPFYDFDTIIVTGTLTEE